MAFPMKHRYKFLRTQCVLVSTLAMFSSCDPSNTEKHDNNSDSQFSVTAEPANDSIPKKSDSAIPFEQDTQKIMETLDILDSIRQAKYN
jgi:hypothetical protein